jgi:hypothetical protein
MLTITTLLLLVMAMVTSVFVTRANPLVVCLLAGRGAGSRSGHSG